MILPVSSVDKENYLNYENVMDYLREKRNVYCSQDEKVMFNIPSYYRCFDLFNIKEICVYAGGFKYFHFPKEQLNNIKVFIKKGLDLYDEIENLSFLTKLLKHEPNLNFDNIDNPFLKKKVKEFDNVIEKLKQIVENLQNENIIQNNVKRTKPENEIIPFYLVKLMELYLDIHQESNLKKFNISKFSIFLADIVQNPSSYSLLDYEKTSLQIVEQASKNHKYPLPTRKHLSFRFFHFFSSLHEMKYFPKNEMLLLQTFSKQRRTSFSP